MMVLIGKKMGMTRVFGDNGAVTGVTVLEVGPCVVVQKKTEKADGYNALQLGYGPVAERKVSQPVRGHFVKKNVPLRKHVAEARLTTPEEVDKFAVGQEIKAADFFKEGDFVDVRGLSRGMGFAGVMKRHNFHGGHKTHDHEYFRHGGSIGQHTHPGRVFKGMKMPGRMGGARVTVLNLKVVEVNSEKNLVVVRGAVPGVEGSVVYLRKAVKKKPKS